MDLEEQTLHYYLRAFSLIIIFFFILLTFYTYNTFNKDINLKTNPIKISKGDKIEEVLTNNVYNLSTFDITLTKIYFKIIHYVNKTYFHYGNFKINEDSSLFDLIKIISKPSNIVFKITIVEGWSKKQLDLELSKFFIDYDTIPYEDIIADTYFLQKNSNFNSFLKKLKKDKKEYFNSYKKNNLLNNYTNNELMIIASLLEKEGLNNEDKKKISSVIFNRLNKKMKLQIDATVLYSLTDGNYDLGRNLLISDLKINHPFNTYLIKGLPPKPISYVGKKTLDILFENNKSDFLFYFFNYSLKRHIFSKSFDEHKEKLNAYRKKQ